MQPGDSLQHYRLVDKLGEGGMGVVWKALDTKLDREVAIKLLPEALAADAERLARFEREAKLLATLNHPHIAGIYGLDEDGGRRFIAMEYVEGEDLAERLKRGPLPVEEAVEIARAVADALSTAHARGVIHRDLKPANVVLTPDGTPKVLDFGLAKAVAPDSVVSGEQPVSLSLSPTVTSFGTVAGVIIGTAAYMSPEQARGRPVDRRADLWALGAMLYEMLTGRSPFPGETISDTLASVLKSEPDWDALPASTPAGVRRLLRRCLEKKAGNRLHDAADARIELAEAFAPGEEAPVPAPARSPGRWIALALLALAAGAALGFLLRGGAPETAAPRPIVSSLPAPEGVKLNLEQIPLALSPDGEQVVFVGNDEEGNTHLYVRRLAAAAARRIAGTEGALTPFWSHDGTQIAFHTETRLMRVPAEGGTPQLIAEGIGRDGTWNRDGIIVYASVNGPLMQVDASGGAPRPVGGTLDAGTDALAPQFLPDGRRFIFQRESLGASEKGIYLGSLDSDEVTRLADHLWNAAYADGHLLFIQDDNLVAQPLDLEARRLTGEPRRIAGPVARLNYPFHGFFSVAHGSGRLVFLRSEQSAGLAEVVWVDRQGNELQRPGIRGDLYNPRLSRDDRRLALDVSTQETHGDIWIFDLARGSSRQLTDDPIDESRPVWMPGDEEIVFFRIPDLYAIGADGRSEARVVYADEAEKVTCDVSPDGRYAMFFESRANDRDLRYVDLQSGQARDWLSSEHEELDGRFSPDGNWVAYVSSEPGRAEIFIDRFPERGERFRVSDAGGTSPVWRRDGRELYYFSTTGDVMAVPLDMESERDPVGTPRKLFKARLRRDYFDASADAQRFLLLERIDPEVDEITLIQNWAAIAGEE